MKLILKNTSLKFEKNATKHFIDIDTYTEAGTEVPNWFFGNFLPTYNKITAIDTAKANKTMRVYDVSSLAGSTVNVEIDYNISPSAPGTDPYIIAFISTKIKPTETDADNRINIDEGLLLASKLTGANKTWGIPGKPTALCRITGKVTIPINAVSMVVRVGEIETVPAGGSPYGSVVYYAE